MADDHDVPLLEQYREQLAQYKRELSTICDDLVALDLEDNDDLFKSYARLESLHFDYSHRVKKLLSAHSFRSTTVTTAATDNKGSRLPKLDIPTFNGDVLQWGLKARYNRPRLIHRAHVHMIVDAPPLKDGSGKELRRLHDTLQQHLRALKSMKLEPNSSFITSVVELKLNTDTMFEWQKHSQDKMLATRTSSISLTSGLRLLRLLFLDHARRTCHTRARCQVHLVNLYPRFLHLLTRVASIASFALQNVIPCTFAPN